MRYTCLILVGVLFVGCEESKVVSPPPTTTTTPAIVQDKSKIEEQSQELQEHQNAAFSIPEKEITISRLQAQYDTADPNSESAKGLKALLEKEKAELEALQKTAADTKPKSPEIITSDLAQPKSE